jgi:hypothetical protein
MVRATACAISLWRQREDKQIISSCSDEKNGANDRWQSPFPGEKIAW